MNVRRVVLVLLFILMQISIPASQKKTDPESQIDISAYWYNVPENSFQEAGSDPQMLFPTLEIYGNFPESPFRLNVSVFTTGVTAAATYKIEYTPGTETATCRIQFNEGICKIVQRVKQLPENPKRIWIEYSIKGHTGRKEIKCKYHRLSGQIIDSEEKPMKALVLIGPDDFFDNIGVWSDERGKYAIDLPQRTYNTVYCDDESYRVKTLENWGFNIIMDQDQNIDFKIGSGEIYNLHAWPNNGGYGTFLIYFRPMVLHSIKNESSKITLNGKEFDLLDTAPDLQIGNLKCRINGRETEIYSLQKIYETGIAQGKPNAMPAYLLQVDRGETGWSGKQTVAVEYKVEMMQGKTKVMVFSRSLFQSRLNYSGMSWDSRQ